SVVEERLVQAGQGQWPLREQSLRIRARDADPAERLVQVRRRQRMGFDGNEVETRAPAWVAAPGRAGGEAVGAAAESQFEQGERGALRPALAQAGADHEDGLGLGEGARGAPVDIAEVWAQQAPGSIAGKPAGFDGQGVVEGWPRKRG